MDLRFLIFDFRLKSKIENRKSKIHGVTVVEFLMVMSVLAVLMIAIMPHIRSGRQVWEAVGDRHADVMQNARIGMDKMTRELRQIRRSISSAGSSYIEFVDRDDNVRKFQYNAGYLEYGPPGSLNPLAGPVDSLSFTYYRKDGVTETTTPEEISSVLIQLTISDSEGKVGPITLLSRVFIRREGTVVINEVMYHPSGQDDRWEWVELYNSTCENVDVAGWKFSDSNQIDDILGDGEHGTGSTVIPAGGYAIITTQVTEMYDPGSPYSVDPDAIKLQVDDGKLGNGLHNNQDTVAILDDSDEMVDSVSYDDSWGGDGNDHTLERIDAQENSNDPLNWLEGPLYGTPGSEN
jgi:competence protein ComGC